MIFNVIPLTPAEGKAKLDFLERSVFHRSILSFLESAAVEYLPENDDHKDKIKLIAELLCYNVVRSDVQVIDLCTRKARLLAEVVEKHHNTQDIRQLEIASNLAKDFRDASELLAQNVVRGTIEPMSTDEIDLEISYVVIPKSPASLLEQ